MTIDVDRLAVDADYWNEVAPEGATHFMHTEKFVKWVFGVEWVFYASSGREWKKTHCNWMLKQYLNDGTFVLAKPKSHPTDTQPAESGAQISAEWDGEGLPPVGTECEYQPDPVFNEWCAGVFLAEIDGEYFILINGSHQVDRVASNPNQIRPIRSQAEQQKRGLVINAALEACGYDASCFAIAGAPESMDLLNELYDLGFLQLPTKMLPNKARGESE
jgi:hypothetical protein